MSAQAASALSVRMTDSGGSVTVADNSADDTDGAIGIIDFDSTTAGAWLSVWSHASGQFGFANTANTADLSGSVEAEHNDPTTARTLTIEISHAGYLLVPTPWDGLHSLGGTTPGTVTTEAFWSDTNTLFDAKYSIGGPFSHTNSGASAFSGFSADLFDVEFGANPFSMTTIITITHDPLDDVATQTTSFAELAPAPVPAALPLLASAFGIMGLVRSRRRRA